MHSEPLGDALIFRVNGMTRARDDLSKKECKKALKSGG